MTTLTRSPKTVKPKAADRPPVVSLALAIDHLVYGVTPIALQADDDLVAFRLEKRDGSGAVYDVLDRSTIGQTCSCPDWIYRRDGLDAAGCKHLKALRALGMIQPAAFHDPEPSAAFIAHRAEVKTKVILDSAPTHVTRVPDEFDTPCCPPTEAAPCAACRPSETATVADLPPAPKTELSSDSPLDRDIAAVCASWGTTPERMAASARLDREFKEGQLAEDEDAGDPATWPEWVDDFVWNPTPEEGDDAPLPPRRVEPSEADRAWWAANAPGNARGYIVIARRPRLVPMTPEASDDYDRPLLAGYPA